MYRGITEIAIDSLNLDPENPRLPSYIARDPQTVFEYLAKSASIDEIMSAIATNGYFASEPLIGIPNGDRYTIIEGNRRLTALKLLSGDSYEGMPSKLRDIREAADHTPTKVPVAIYDGVEEILSYLGNKHIAGVKPWGALAKSRYIKKLFDALDDGLDYSEKIRKVTQAIGSRRDFIQRALKALEAYSYASDRNFFNLAGVSEETVKFSLLSTALDYSGIQSYVYEDPEQDFQNRTHIHDNLRDLFQWLFQSIDGAKTKLGESRNLKLLSKIVMNTDGLRQFKLGETLEQAYKIAGGAEDQFDGLIVKIQSQIRTVNSMVAEVASTELRRSESENIFKQARQLRNALKEEDEDD